MEYVRQYREAGYGITVPELAMYGNIQEQKYMSDNRTHKAEDRIVSLSQPYIRPIVRGKAKSPVEFGAKYDVSIDENGHARLDRIDFTLYNASTVFVDAVERNHERTGYYPKRVLVDKIYRTRDNLRFCKNHHIEISGSKPGKSADGRPKVSKDEKQGEKGSIEAGQFFSLDKRYIRRRNTSLQMGK